MCANADMILREGGRRIGEDDTVVVIHDLSTFVSGRTASGDGTAGGILEFGSW